MMEKREFLMQMRSLSFLFTAISTKALLFILRQVKKSFSERLPSKRAESMACKEFRHTRQQDSRIVGR